MNDSPTPPMPRHLLVTGILALLWNSMGAFDYLMSETKNQAYMEKFSPELLAFFHAIPAWAVGVWAIAVWGGVLGTVLLLMRRRLAAPVFLVSWLAVIVMNIRTYVLSNGLEVMGDSFSLGFAAAIFLVALGLVIYAKALVAKGVLR